MPRIDERIPVIERLAERGVESDRRRGRAAVTNPSGRYEPIARVDEDDGWGSSEELPEFKTHVTIETPRSIISHNESPDIPLINQLIPIAVASMDAFIVSQDQHTPLWASRPGLILNRASLRKRMPPRSLKRNCRRKITNQN